MKSPFKTILISAFGAMAVFSAVTYSSCEVEKCKSIVCANGGVCSDGFCLCPTGYEGPQCETVNRARYIAPWTVTENGSITDAAQYSISIVAGDNISELKIKNFRNLLVGLVKAYVQGDTLYIPQQVVDSQEVIGTGILEDDKFYGRYGKLTVRYKITDLRTGNTDDFGIEGPDASLWNK